MREQPHRTTRTVRANPKQGRVNQNNRGHENGRNDDEKDELPDSWTRSGWINHRKDDGNKPQQSTWGSGSWGNPQYGKKNSKGYYYQYNQEQPDEQYNNSYGKKSNQWNHKQYDRPPANAWHQGSYQSASSSSAWGEKACPASSSAWDNYRGCDAPQ